MESFSEASWTDCVNVRQRDITSSLTASENILGQEDRDVYIDVTEELESNSKERQPVAQNDNNLDIDERLDTVFLKDSGFVTSQLTERSVVTNGVTRCAPPGGGVVNTTGDHDGEVMDDVSDSDVVDSDDDGCGLVVNMEFTDDVKSVEPSPTTLAQLSIPTMTPAVISSAGSYPPVVGASTEGMHPQPRNVDNTPRMLTASQNLTESSSNKMASVTSSCPNPRSLPIHCVIEQMPQEVAVSTSNGCQESHIVLDTYAILPGTTLFSELVKTSLLRLGYSPCEIIGAKGGIQLKNWKTLLFEAITDKGEATIEEILGEVTSVATLKIHLNSQVRSCSTSQAIKDRLLHLLLTKSVDVLVQAGCPVEKSLLEAISTGEVSQSISEQVCTSFNDWYMRQKVHNSLPETCSYSKPFKSSKPPSVPPLQTAVASESLALSSMSVSSILVAHPQPSDLKVQPVTAPKYPASLSRSSPLNLDIKKEPPTIKSENSSKASVDSQELQLRNHFFQKESDNAQRNKKHIDKTPDKNCIQSELFKFSLSSSEGNIPSTLQNHPSNPYLGLMPGKTRIRTSFDPEQEIPRLQKWFSANQHPTREQMMRFMHELNALESRKGRRPLDLTNIIYWFKNARAAQRRATRVLDDSFENEENVDMNSAESGNSTTDSVPPFLPNKNAVYIIPFHPYPHLVSGSGAGANDRGSLTSGADIEEPYDLSLTKRPSSELSKIHNGREKEENHFLSLSTSPSPTKSSSTSSECENQGSMLKKKKPYCPPRFPALLDVASKMRQEIPLRSDDIYFKINSSNNISNHISCRESPYRSGSSDMEHSIKNEDIENNFSSPSTPVENGDSRVNTFSGGFKIKHEDDDKYLNCHHSRKNYQHSSHTSHDSGLELGQVQKEDNGKIDSSDDDDEDDNTNDSYNSEEELKLRMKQSAAAAAVVDYASAMHNNVSRLTAANMAALSLAQMGQPLHIPQLTSSLAMAYYPMDPRFYSQSAVPHSLSASPPTSLTTTHASHLSQLSLRQSQDCSAHIESRSPLPSPSIMQQSLSQLNHHHHHHQHHQQQSPQQHHHRHNSEPRKRRTRVFIDPLTEIPKLEKWFTEDTHPSAFMIDKYCEELNKCEYRHKFPKLEPKNIQLWFKNHRAKVKRMKVSCDEQGDQNGTGCHDDEIDD